MPGTTVRHCCSTARVHLLRLRLLQYPPRLFDPQRKSDALVIREKGAPQLALLGRRHSKGHNLRAPLEGADVAELARREEEDEVLKEASAAASRFGV